MTRDTDKVFEILSRRPRRVALMMVKEEGTVSVPTLLRQVSGTVQEGRVSLEHAHLPQIADADYIVWDESRDKISEGPEFGEIEPVLDLLEDSADELPIEWP